MLNEKLPNLWMGRGGLTIWPARFPDLSPLHYVSYGYVKDEVYKATCLNFLQVKKKLPPQPENYCLYVRTVWKNSEFWSVIVKEK